MTTVLSTQAVLPGLQDMSPWTIFAIVILLVLAHAQNTKMRRNRRWQRDITCPNCDAAALVAHRRFEMNIYQPHGHG